MNEQNYIRKSCTSCLNITNSISFFLVRLLREELQLLQEQGSYVGEVVRVMDKKKVLVKVCCALTTVLCSTLYFVLTCSI